MRSGFRYGYSVFQVEYSRNLLFASGRQMDRVFHSMMDRTRCRLDVPTLRTLFGAKQRPDRKGSTDSSPRLAVMIEKPRGDLTLFKVHVGLLTLKGYTKGEHVLRLTGDRAQHQTPTLRPASWTASERSSTALAGMVNRFTTTLDCLDTGFLPDNTLDHLPLPSQIGATRVGGIALNKPRIRATLTAVLALAAAPAGFTVKDLTAKVHAITGHTDYTTRQAAYDLRKLRGKNLVIKPTRSRPYHLPPQPARTITALLTLREHVIAPILAGIRSPHPGRKPAHWTTIDRDYERLRIDMHTLFHHLNITTEATAA